MKYLLLVALGLACGVGGCASVHGDVNNDGVVNPQDAGRYLNGPPLQMSPELATKFAQEPNPSPPAAAAALRNEAIDVLLQTSNSNCNDYMVGIGAGRNTYGVGFSILGSAFSTLGSLVAKGPAANGFSAASNFSQGTSSTLTQTLFGGREFPLLYSAVMAGRRAEQAEIIRRRDGGYFNSWSGSSILTLMRSYDQLCGVNYGIERLTIAAQQPSAQSTVLIP
ncbi:hypothetical protein MMB232_01210 [Brevundimonas subvibrioides]|uniref:hypothetical protein n=1 Tax=Brevundimonas subvibrioides TaxID=74313 RepID=UPI0032D56F33